MSAFRALACVLTVMLAISVVGARAQATLLLDGYRVSQVESLPPADGVTVGDASLLLALLGADDKATQSVRELAVGPVRVVVDHNRLSAYTVRTEPDSQVWLQQDLDTGGDVQGLQFDREGWIYAQGREVSYQVHVEESNGRGIFSNVIAFPGLGSCRNTQAIFRACSRSHA